ncbi:hypothetical protein E2C01_061792 [Portunus trituberculatus]|uniref:Uncharacterized protein n=1 Tax=Portunus trituberculatus TaxID=210409 RepID=A0A5B7HDD4_PORTR|nr:hypothetical protein [Portunus trituberculatus]
MRATVWLLCCGASRLGSAHAAGPRQHPAAAPIRVSPRRPAGYQYTHFRVVLLRPKKSCISWLGCVEKLGAGWGVTEPPVLSAGVPKSGTGVQVYLCQMMYVCPPWPAPG